MTPRGERLSVYLSVPDAPVEASRLPAVDGATGRRTRPFGVDKGANGAGDAFFAGVLHAALDGAETLEALRVGSRQAVRALESSHLSPLVSLP